jgi:hypothetical protein
VSREANAKRPRRSDGVTSIRLGILAMVVVIGRILAVQWTGPIRRLDMMLVYSVVVGLSLRGAWFGLSGLRTGNGMALSGVGMVLNLLIFIGLGVLTLLILTAGH